MRENDKDKDHSAALLCVDPSAQASTEALPSMTKQAADFIAVSFRNRIKELARMANAKPTYEGEYAPAVRYYAAACDAARAVLQERLEALDLIGSGNQAAPEHSASAHRSAAQELDSHSTSPSPSRTVEDAKLELDEAIARWAVKSEGPHDVHSEDALLQRAIDALIQAVREADQREIERLTMAHLEAADDRDAARGRAEQAEARLRELVSEVQAVAAKGYKHWDLDEDSKAGKVLSALAGVRGCYPRIDAIFQQAEAQLVSQGVQEDQLQEKQERLGGHVSHSGRERLKG